MKHNKWLRALILLLPTSIFAFPIVYMLIKSFAKKGIGNYIYVLTKIRIEVSIFNSFLVAVCTVLLVLILALPAAFAFSKLYMKGKKVLYLTVLLALMVPGICIAVPMVKTIKAMGLVNNHLSLILCYSALNAPLALVLARGFVDELPDEIMGAALIDGCNTFQTLLYVYLPLCGPVVSVISVFTFLNSWNEYLYATLFMKKDYLQMASTIPNKFQVSMYTNVPALFAGLVIVQLPVLILYLCFQRLIQEGMTAGAIKG